MCAAWLRPDVHWALNDLKSGSDCAAGRARYIRYEVRAQTLGQLRTWANEHGRAAVEEARLSALLVWMMGRGDNPPGSIGAVAQHRAHTRQRLGFPSFYPWRDKPAWSTPGAEAMTNKMLATWEAEGSPHLLNAIQQTQQHIHSARLAADERRTAWATAEQHLGEMQ